MTPAVRFLALGGSALLAISPPALARSKQDSDGGTNAAVAACIVHRQPAFAVEWVNALPASPVEAALIQEHSKDVDVCLRKSGATLDATSQPAIRRAVAGELLMRNFARLPAVVPFPVGTAPWFASRIISSPDAQFDRATLRTENFANCVALSQWPETRALLAAGPASATQAAEALRPSLGACLTPSLTVALKIASLRSMLAEAVFHIMSTASLTGAASAKR